MAQTSAPDDGHQPARIVTRYTLTSTPHGDAHDPTAWRLLASNDGGGTWATLDTQTNQQFNARSQPVTYFISNRQPYSTYRLQIDAIKSTEVSLDNSVQLAGFNLAGPLVNMPEESKLQVVGSSSCANPINGPAEFALDDDPATAWSDYGLGLPGGCWLQVDYALDSTKSTILVTNLSQARMLTRLPPAPVGLANGGDRVLSNLTAKVMPPRSLVGYALTSANDQSGRDPRNWELLGSNDDGKTWAVVDSRTDEVFTERFERRVFNLTTAACFRLFRLQIGACAAMNEGCQLGSLEPLYANPQADPDYSLVVGASMENPPSESADMAFDGDFRTKWLSFADASPENPCWLQWQLTPREPDLPVIGQRQLDLLSRRLRLNKLLDETNLAKPVITGYALTSANDFPGRDPRDWKLLGSNDAGKTWDVLDSRQHETFGKRGQRRVFPLAHPVAYRRFRLQIDSVLSPADVGCVQLAKLEPLFDDPQSASRLTILVSSQGEYFPAETVNHLFDGNVNTKWLDSTSSSSNRASWVEWHYAGGAGRDVINLNREQITPPLAPKRMEMQLSATVLFTDPARGLAGLGDQTDFQWVHLQPWPAGVAPGLEMELKGQLQVKGGSLFVSQTRAESLHPLAASNAMPPPAQPYVSGSIVGQISGIFSGPSYSGATLTLSNGTSLLVRLPGPRFPIPPEVACPVRVEGIIQYVLAPGRTWVPGFLWVAKPEDIIFAPESEADWNELPEYSPSLPLPSLVRLRGVVEAANQTGSVALRVGTNRIMANLSSVFPAKAGVVVEVAGWLTAEAGELKLRHACLDTAEPAAAAPPLLTRISEVRRLLHWNRDARARVKTQGIITYVDPSLGEFYLQDGEDGMLVRGQMNAGLCPKLSEEGNYVELEGVVQDADLDATAFVQVLGRGRLPTPPHPSWDHLLSGDDDGRWVAVEGVITEAQNERITLSIAGGQIVAWIKELDSDAARSLPGSMARVRGVCAPILNSHRQRIGMRLLVPSLECVDLLGLVPENLLDLPLQRMKSVMSADCDPAVTQQRYVKISGVVTCKQGRLLFLQNQADGMRVILRDDSAVVPGDVVEAVGMPQPDGLSAKLIQAVLRPTGHAPLPAAVPMDLTRVNTADLAQQRDATLVETEAILVNESADASHWALNLRSEEAKQVFAAYLPADARLESQTAIPVGSRLRIKGVFKAIRDKTLDVDQAATSFEMYLNSPGDIVVLERPSWWTAQHTLELAAVFSGALAAGLTWIWLLRKQVRQRTRDLAAEVAERKRLQADADKAHQQLLVVARQAGMAEVATGILHNVGNVLNSVNISGGLVKDHLNHSRIDGLAKAVDLLHQNEPALGDFFKSDNKGRKLLPYLENLARHQAANQAGALEELENLRKNIEHIKEIVSAQQSAAKFAGLTERLGAVELVEDALRLNAHSLGQHQINVVREFDPRTPMVNVDRHKVLQILVNLINNARQACDESGRADKRIVLGIQNGGRVIKVSVGDNGAGITAENLDRVFNHGFTTRKTGHGFGLHNAALAAKEMGGSLHVASPGPGEGATFTLELPVGDAVKPPKPAAAEIKSV
jgi:signal transduction histidine kinase